MFLYGFMEFFFISWESSLARKTPGSNLPRPVEASFTGFLLPASDVIMATIVDICRGTARTRLHLHTISMLYGCNERQQVPRFRIRMYFTYERVGLPYINLHSNCNRSCLSKSAIFQTLVVTEGGREKVSPPSEESSDGFLNYLCGGSI